MRSRTTSTPSWRLRRRAEQKRNRHEERERQGRRAECLGPSSEFNLDLGYSSGEEQTRAWVTQNLGSLPPIVERNADASGTDVVGYLTESPGFSAFVLEDGTVYETYSTGWRGVEFLMGYYPILDRAPKGRDEDDGFQLWIRRHDEYGSD
jgi:predicted dithiol-disulfide oxidoreductase (DUF899 family)